MVAGKSAESKSTWEPDRGQALEEEEVVDDPRLGGHHLAGQIFDGPDGFVDDDGVVAGPERPPIGGRSK